MPKTKQKNIRKKTKISGGLSSEIQILMEERSLLSIELQELEARITQILVLGFGAIGGIASYLIQQQVNVPIFVWTLLPIALAVILAFGMIGIYNLQAHVFELRLLTSKLHELIGDTDLPLSYDRNSPTSRFVSTRSGNPKVRIPYIVGLAGLAFVFLVVIILGYTKIYDYHHFLGNIYLGGCVIITTLLLLSFHGAFFDLPSYLTPIEKKEIKPKDYLKYTYEKLLGLEWFYFLFPRPADIVQKSLYFWFGFIIAYFWQHQFLNNQLAIVKMLFEGNISDLSSPYPRIGLGIVYFIVAELFIQQAKVLWNDLRDSEGDSDLVLNRNLRGLTAGALKPDVARLHVILRWGIGLLIGFYLNITFFILILAISILQILYEFFVKQYSVDHPIFSKYFISFGYALRFLVGASALGANIFSPLLLIYAGIFLFCGAGGLSAFWRLDAAYRKKEGHKIEARPQGRYFHLYGWKEQRVSFASSLILALFGLIIFEHINDFYAITFIISQTLRSNSSVIDTTVVIMLIFISGLLGYLFAPLIRVTGFAPSLLNPLLGSLSPAFTFMLILAPQIFPRHFGLIHLAASMFTLTIMYIVVNETATYEELTLLYVPQNFSIFTTASLLYIFQSKTNIHLMDLIKLGMNIAKYDFGKHLVIEGGKVTGVRDI